jgi:hypothetical protein
MRTFTCRSTFLYGPYCIRVRSILLLYKKRAWKHVSVILHEHEEWNNTELGANICICPFESAVSLADCREYWMIYRWPGFLAVEWFGSSHSPPLLLRSSSCLSFSVYLCVAVRAYWRERGGGNLKLYAGKKAWSSTNHSILYGQLFRGFPYYFCLMIEGFGFGSGSIILTDGSESGSESGSATLISCISIWTVQMLFG